MSITTNTTATQRQGTDYMYAIGGNPIVCDHLIETIKNVASRVFNWTASEIKSFVGRITTPIFASAESSSNAQASITKQPAPRRILIKPTNHKSNSSSSVISEIEKEINKLLDKGTTEPQIESKNPKDKLVQLEKKKNVIDEKMTKLENVQRRIDETTDADWTNSDTAAFKRLHSELERLDGEYSDVLLQIQSLEFML